VQGDVREHDWALQAAGAEARLVRLPEDPGELDGIVLPGGEGTVMTCLLQRWSLWEPLGQELRAGLPLLATCAGAVLARPLPQGAGDGRAGRPAAEI
jgi:pyridoxal 5'-phosphate synthase pdxT subunit